MGPAQSAAALDLVLGDDVIDLVLELDDGPHGSRYPRSTVRTEELAEHARSLAGSLRQWRDHALSRAAVYEVLWIFGLGRREAEEVIASGIALGIFRATAHRAR